MNQASAAKLIAPHTDRIVRRTRVLAALDDALQAGCCWVAAPAGYGKSTALADYLERQQAPHIWYRTDEGDRDIASLFHHLTLALHSPDATHGLPVFGAEYADQPQAFAHRFFRQWFARLEPGTLLVLDDLHYADVAPFRAVLTALLHELPDSLRCVCLARTLPPAELDDLRHGGRLNLIGQDVLEFTEHEARRLIGTRLRHAATAIDISAARGWAIGLVLLAERSSAAPVCVEARRARDAFGDANAPFGALGRQLFDTLSPSEQEILLKLSLLPEITFDLAAALAGSDATGALIGRLHERQLLNTRGSATRTVFHLHDLLLDFLHGHLAVAMTDAALAQLRAHTATLLDGFGYADAAIELALLGRAWPLARRVITRRAEALLAQGRRTSLIEWCAQLPDGELDAWLCYWLGVANLSNDASAERWLSRAWLAFSDSAELRGQCLCVAQAVLSKTDSWRTHSGLPTWTQRALQLVESTLPAVRESEELLVLAGFVRAFDFAENYQSEASGIAQLELRLLQRLAQPREHDSSTLRLVASYVLIDHADLMSNAALFEQAVDSVIDTLREECVPAWTLGLWLVAFGAACGRYFPYARRGFAYASAEDALRAAIAIGERESLRGVEFGALYHLQLQMKQRNDFAEVESLVDRLAQIADSRHTTQVAVVADCQAALYTQRGNVAEAHLACARFMTAIETANEPPIECWPHYITRLQVLLAEGKPGEAAEFLERLAHLFDGGMLARTQAHVLLARAVQARQEARGDYLDRLRDCLRAMRALNWSAVLLNLPSLLAQLCADALTNDIEPDYCRSLIERRRLRVPDSRPREWPWSLRLHVLGEFRIERDRTPLDLGAKPPARALDILRMLAVARDHTCSLESLHDAFWPDADGDQAKAACEQALHRLRKLLGDSNLIVQREGRLRLAPFKIWVDLDDWDGRLRELQGTGMQHARNATELERLYLDFPGPVLWSERARAWSLPVAERVADKFLDLATRVGERHEAQGNIVAAHHVYLRALEFYPTATRIHEALIRNRLADNDSAVALENYARYDRMLKATLGAQPCSAIRALIQPLLGVAPTLT